MLVFAPQNDFVAKKPHLLGALPGVSLVVDTIGCGDSFLANWLLDLLQGSGPERALRRPRQRVRTL